MQEIASSFPLAAILFGVFLGAFVAGFAGFGFSAAAGAFLLHVLPASSAVPLMMLCSVVVQTTGLFVLRKSLVFRGAFPFMLSGALGVPIAVAILGNADPATLRFGFGIFLVVYTGQALALPVLLRPRPLPAIPSGFSATGDGSRVSPGPVSIACVGFAGGLIGGLTAMPGAALSVWADIRGCDKTMRRATVQPFILAMQILALVVLAVNGRLFDPELLWLFGLATLPLLLGTAVGLRLYGRVSGDTFRTAVLVVILASGGTMLLR